MINLADTLYKHCALKMMKAHFFMFPFRNSGGECRSPLKCSESWRSHYGQTTSGECGMVCWRVCVRVCDVKRLSPAYRWVREFLNEENQGLDVLVEYLSFAQYAVT